MKLNYERIGARIREKRTAARMSQASLAELADTSPQYISHIETGRKKASLGVIVNVAAALDTSVDYLLTGNMIVMTEDSERMLNRLTEYEKHILLDIMAATRNAFEENRWRLPE